MAKQPTGKTTPSAPAAKDTGETPARSEGSAAQAQSPAPASPDAPDRLVQPSPEIHAAAIAADLRALSGEIINNAEKLRHTVANSQIRESLEGIRSATAIFQQMADNAAVEAQRQSEGMFQMAAMQRVNQLAGAVAPHPGTPVDAGCRGGCGGGCGDENKASCCMLVYISKVRVLEGQNMADKNQLELIIAVQAQETWGLVPGLSGNLGVNAKAGWVSVYGPIAKFCVPCSECLTIPLFVEVMEVETNALGGRPEFGSDIGTMTLRCDCQIAPARIPVRLDGGGVGKGIVEVEISAKRSGERCCG